MDLADLYRYLPRLEKGLRASYARQWRTAPPGVRRYLRTNEEFTLRGGKRFRAILLLAGYHLVTGRRPDPVLSAAAALEHFQSWMLIHDDIIDHAEQRRGGTTVHLALASEHRKDARIGSSDDFGTGMGITLGDLEEPFTVEAILDTPVPRTARMSALQEYVRMARLTAYGQLLDIRNGTVEPAEVTEEEVMTVHTLKSAVYTVVSPLKIGALLAGRPPEQLRELEAIGTDLGVAFQLRDDVLGAGFDADASGKSSNDLTEGKRTLLVVKAWQMGSEVDRARLTRVLGNPHATPEDVERARDVLRTTGSLAYSEERIDALSKRALARLDRSRTIRSGAKPLVREIADRLVRRKF